jgi:hypothetical protein
MWGNKDRKEELDLDAQLMWALKESRGTEDDSEVYSFRN